MLTNQSNNTVSFSLFSQFFELVCLLSTRQAGDLNIAESISPRAEEFLKSQGIEVEHFVAMEQVHEASVVKVDATSGSKVVKGADGFITQSRALFLGVNMADCVPIFFYDPQRKVVAVVHAGWKGTSGNIAGNAVKKLQDLGSDPKNVYVAIGPHIGACCYDIPEKRARLFKESLNDDRVVFETNGKWFLDLGQANKKQLMEVGVAEKNIDAPITCTCCQNNRFFSYRKDSKETFGEMLGIIGMKNPSNLLRTS